MNNNPIIRKMASIIVYFLIISPFIAPDVAAREKCNAASSCADRCFEKWTPEKLGRVIGRADSGATGPGPPYPHLQCRCDRYCITYGDCCSDSDSLCPWSNWGKMYLMKNDKRYLNCRKLRIPDFPEEVAVLGRCPTNADPFLQVLCQSPPSFDEVETFVPVTDSQGRVYRNRYCAKCIHSSVKVQPWKMTRVDCRSPMTLELEGVGLLNGRQDRFTKDGLSEGFMETVNGWLTSNCELSFEPTGETNFHFCDDRMRLLSDEASCPRPYDPVWAKDNEGNYLLFRNSECVSKRISNDSHCVGEAGTRELSPSTSQPTSPVRAFSQAPSAPYGFYPGSLTILLNFGADGKTRVDMVDEGSLSSMRRCPKGSVLETATKKCKKLHCPIGTILLEDGRCKDPSEDRENIRYETRVAIDLKVNYNDTLLPELGTHWVQEYVKLGFAKYLNLDEGGMLNFSMKVRARAKDLDGDGNKDIYAECDIKMKVILPDETQDDVKQVQQLFEDFNNAMKKYDQYSDAMTIVKFNEQIMHSVVPNENITDAKEMKEIKWCNNGEIKFYNDSFTWWQEPQTMPDGKVINQTVVRTNDTETIYRTGEFDMAIAVRTDLHKDETIVVAWVVVCEKNPRIENKNCPMEVMLNSSEYRYLKNRSVEVLSDHQIYGLDEYEKCRTVEKLKPLSKLRRWSKEDFRFETDKVPAMMLRPAKTFDPYANSDKILVCLKPNERFFFTFSKEQGVITVVLLPISILGLVGTMAIHAFFKRLRNLPGLILLHLTLTLFLCQSTLLFSMTYPAVRSWMCTIVAVVNHYLLLVSFCWMNVYAFNIYHTFQTFTSVASLKRFSVRSMIRKYMAYAYGVPAALILACIGAEIGKGWIHYGGDDLVYKVRGAQEGNENYFGYACWINNQVASLTVFGLPLIIMVCLNLVLYFLTVRHVKAHSRVKMLEGSRRSKVPANSDNPVELKTFMRLSTVMGFGWLLGLSGATIKQIASTDMGKTIEEIISFLFIFTTSLQGLAIFVAFTTGSRVKREFKDLFSHRGEIYSDSRRASKDSVTTITSISMVSTPPPSCPTTPVAGRPENP